MDVANEPRLVDVDGGNAKEVISGRSVTRCTTSRPLTVLTVLETTSTPPPSDEPRKPRHGGEQLVLEREAAADDWGEEIGRVVESMVDLRRVGGKCVEEDDLHVCQECLRRKVLSKREIRY